MKGLRGREVSVGVIALMLGACTGNADGGGGFAGGAATGTGAMGAGMAGNAGFFAGGAAGTPAGGAGAGTTGATGGSSPGVSGAAGAGGVAGAPIAGSAGTGSAGASGSGGAGDLCDHGAWDGTTTPKALSLTGNTFAHDPTMIEENGTFYRFWTGNRIPSAKSTNLTSWSQAPAVYPDAYPAWVTTWLAGAPGNSFNFPWAPDVSRFNGRVHIYSSFSTRFGDNVSCITHLSTASVAQGNWTDHGPVICTEGDESYNAIDADVGLDANGTPYLSFGSFWDGIMAFPLNADGSRAGTELTRLAWASEIEAPVLFRRCGWYYLFVTWGLCCPGEGRSVDSLTYRVAVGRSQNILGPYVDKNGMSMVSGGGTLVVQGDATYIAAGHSDVIATGGKIYHLYHAYRRSDGDAVFRIVEMPFDAQGWPVAGGP